MLFVVFTTTHARPGQILQRILAKALRPAQSFKPAWAVTLKRPSFRRSVGVEIRVLNAYPANSRDRDRWILAQRPARSAVDPERPHAFLIEEERTESGEFVSSTTIFLTNRECPWRCLMCDLWKNTLTESVPPGAVPAQIDWALRQLEDSKPGTEGSGKTTRTHPGTATTPSPREARAGRGLGRGAAKCAQTTNHLLAKAATGQIKLYNSGSFFDPRAIPPEDYPAIAERVRSFERVIVECHPALIGQSALRFRDLFDSQLEVAMGLETAHPDVLAKLNKRMTLDQFSRAADFLRKNEIALRVFILVKPPFLDEAEALHWAKRSLDFAFDCGATVASLIPTRAGNGALDALASRGQFSPPKLSTLEAAHAYGIGLKRDRVFADLWDLEKFSDCAKCFAARAERLRRMNLEQIIRPIVMCRSCHES